MFPRVLYVDQNKALELDWFGFGSLQTRNRYGVVRRAQPHQKHAFLEVIRLFQAHGQPVHPSNLRCSQLMAQFTDLLAEPPDSLAWRVMLQADLRDVARAFAEDDSPGIPSARPSVANEAADETARFMIRVRAATGGFPRRMFDDPFIVGAAATYAAVTAKVLSNGQATNVLIEAAMIEGVERSFLGLGIARHEVIAALQRFKNHPEYAKAVQVVSLILGARYGLKDMANDPLLQEARADLERMPKAFRTSFGANEADQLAYQLTHRHFLTPVKEKYGELWRTGDVKNKEQQPR